MIPTICPYLISSKHNDPFFLVQLSRAMFSTEPQKRDRTHIYREGETNFNNKKIHLNQCFIVPRAGSCFRARARPCCHSFLYHFNTMEMQSTQRACLAPDKADVVVFKQYFNKRQSEAGHFPCTVQMSS